VYGDIYYAMGRTNRANTCYEMALQITPTNAEALLNIGNMQAVKGEQEQAIATYLKAAEIAPDDPKPWNNLGVLYLSQQKFEDALAAFEKAISKDETFPMPYYNAATILQRSGKPAAAMDLLDKLMTLSPGDEEFKRAHERGKMILDRFQQAAGWKIIGVDVAELVKTLVQDPDGFDEQYKVFLNRMITENASNAFGGDRKRAADALQGILDDIDILGVEVSKIEKSSGLTKYQLKFAIASLVLSGRARFRAIHKEIVLMSTYGKLPAPEKEERASSVRASEESLRKVSTLT
jgi:tetratricopeptide (TPR) repeat protein